jgi:hypothetical protein
MFIWFYSSTRKLRSAGARTVVSRKVYKHLAPPEPERDLIQQTKKGA